MQASLFWRWSEADPSKGETLYIRGGAKSAKGESRTAERKSIAPRDGETFGGADGRGERKRPA
ncbi:hypothetical protein HAHE_42030 [Haloferula helveola]|uniref:Uncharacterized protein n=2 Tax=Haloferula helveola TaxID=490095 RepID=A0ABN6H9K7_9BACT|nr:hypothetical protein HAHE_42030 [Haloferula helveola]